MGQWNSDHLTFGKRKPTFFLVQGSEFVSELVSGSTKICFVFGFCAGGELVFESISGLECGCTFASATKAERGALCSKVLENENLGEV